MSVAITICRSTTIYLVVAVVTSSLSFWVRTLNSWLKSTGRNLMITGILSILRRPCREVETMHKGRKVKTARKRKKEKKHNNVKCHFNQNMLS